MSAGMHPPSHGTLAACSRARWGTLCFPAGARCVTNVRTRAEGGGPAHLQAVQALQARREALVTKRGLRGAGPALRRDDLADSEPLSLWLDAARAQAQHTHTHAHTPACEPLFHTHTVLTHTTQRGAVPECTIKRFCTAHACTPLPSPHNATAHTLGNNIVVQLPLSPGPRTHR